MSDPPARDFEARLLPDSPDARRFIELSSHADDLSDARAALELALRGLRDREEALIDAAAHLTGYAAVAYCRVFFRSTVRESLATEQYVPTEFREIHDLIATYRNRRVAHSQAELHSTFAFVGVHGDEIVPSILALTTEQDIPAPIIERWLELIDHLLKVLAEEQNAAQARILEALSGVSIDVIRTWPANVERTVRSLGEFTARTSRGRYPTGWTLFQDDVN